MLSNCFLAMFMTGMAAGACFCIIGLASPGWFGVYDVKSGDVEVQWIELWKCFRDDSVDNYCKLIWTQSSEDMKATVALVILSILFALVAMVWACCVCFACCMRSCFGPVLPILATAAFMCALGACILYGTKVQPVNIEDLKERMGIGGMSMEQIEAQINGLGWAYSLVITGTVVYFLDIVLGGLVVAFGNF